MKSYLNQKLYCSVFGHNFYRSKSIDAMNDELTCKSCQTVIVTNSYSCIDELSNSTNTIENLLNRLNHLKKI